MDNFMDKIAQKFSAQELIKANSQAEAEELKRIQEQIAAYEGILQDIRKVNLKNAEIAGKIEDLADLCSEKTAELSAGNQTEAVEATQSLQARIEELQKEMEEHVHKECVKVYRNVQAVVVDELKAQTEVWKEENRKVEKRMGMQQPILLITLILSLANTVLFVLNILGIL